MKLLRPLALGLAIVASGLSPTVTDAAESRTDRRGTQEVEPAPDFELPAVQLRIGLGRVLGEHAFLISEAIRTGIAGGAEFEVAAEVLEENTVALVELVDAAYGRDAADAFAEQWRNHIAFLVDYTRAVAAGDADARELATSQLQTYTEDFSALLVEANPGLPADVVQGLIEEHVQQLKQIASFADAEFAEAYPSIRDTYAHMFMIGDGLALGVVDRFGDRFEGRETAFSPALDLRITLDRILGENTYLAAAATRARLTDAGDFDAAVSALEENSADLADQIAEIYGSDAGAAFDSLWRSHTDFYLDYVEAVASGSTDAQTEALDGLRADESDFSAFLAEANPLLDADELEALLATHTEHLVAQVTAWQDEDYASAYDTLHEAYAQTEAVAAGLGGAIADQFPQRFPDAALAPDPSGDWFAAVGWLLVFAAAAAGAGGPLRRWPAAQHLRRAFLNGRPPGG